MAFEDLKARQALAYSDAPFEQLAESAADIHDRLVEALCVRSGERWLDLATGTGPVALRAARNGAQVTAQDLAAGLIETARRVAAEQDIAVTYDVGDCEALPYPDGSFDAISSAHGVVFAPDHQAVARELSRLCRPGGRIGLTAWRPGGAIEQSLRMIAEFAPTPTPGAGAPLDWGRPEYVSSLLGGAFELRFTQAESPQLAWSADALWQLFVTAFGPVKALAKSLDQHRRAQFRTAFTDFYNGYRVPGGISSPREYLLIIGFKRAR